MRLVLRTKGIVGRMRPADDIKSIKNAGFEAAVLDGTVVSDPHEYTAVRRHNFRPEKGNVYPTLDTSDYREELKKRLSDHAKTEKLPLPVALAPYAAFDIGKDFKDRIQASELNDIYRTLAKETLYSAIATGCESIVVRPLFYGIDVKDEWEVNRSFYLELAEIAEKEKSPITILIVNMAKDVNGHLVRGICTEPHDACRWVDELNGQCQQIDVQEEGIAANNKKRFGFCFDIGTATLCGQDLFSAIRPLGDRLKAVIIRDNDGVHDVSMLPFTGCVSGQQTDWLGVLRGIRAAGFDGDIILDFSDTYSAYSVMLNRQMLSFGFEVGRYFLWQANIENIVRKYDKRVLFGAGNMCREYLSNYGKEYPPLFTCDNNSGRWGENFYGITIESPEKLRELSPDTAIFICNMYYNEISKQLKEMDLPNPVEWFSDEYMPSFHMDRLDMAADPRKKS